MATEAEIRAAMEVLALDCYIEGGIREEPHYRTIEQALGELAALRARAEAAEAREARLRAALQPFADAEPFYRLVAISDFVFAYTDVDEATGKLSGGRSITLADLQQARAALGEG